MRLSLTKVAELLGITAVVGSLIFVGYEIRYNSLLAQASTNLDLTELIHEKMMWEAEPQNADIMLRGRADFDSLSEVERHQFEQIVWAYIGVWWTAYDSYDRGMMDDLQWQAWNGSFCKNLPDHYVRVWNNIGGPTFFAPPFVEHFNTCAKSQEQHQGDTAQGDEAQLNTRY